MSYRSSQSQSDSSQNLSQSALHHHDVLPSRPRSKRQRLLAAVGVHQAVKDAANYVCERLEKRQLLSTTLVGGGDVNGVPQENSMEYLDGSQMAVRISLLGDITASFTFAHVTTAGMVSLSNLVSPTPDAVTAAAGSDLFNIDITAAAPDASISIARVALPSPTSGPRPMIPFGSPGFSFTTFNAQTGVLATVTPDANTGAILLGARGYVVPPGGGMPTQTDPLTTIDGVTAGLKVDPGVNMNRFFFGGTVIGRVDIGGSIDTFYAGEILTGDPRGILAGLSADDTFDRNFNVNGDIANLISAGSIGTVSAASGAGTATYQTGFRLTALGHVGEIETQGRFVGSANVEDAGTFKGLGTTQHEEEGTAAPARNGQTAFEGDSGTDDKTGVPSLGDNNRDGGLFNNDTPQNAQVLGTLFSSQDGHGAIQLAGSLNGAMTNGDNVDYYAVPLLGGQTVTVTPAVPVDEFGDLDLGVFGPDAIDVAGTGLISSTFDTRNPLREINQAVTITAKTPGLYYLAVGFDDDPTFSGAGNLAGGGEFDYTLDVTNVKEVALGGLVAASDINILGNVDSTTGQAVPASSRIGGDLGAIDSTGGGIYAIATLNPTPLTSATGNVRVVQANTIGNLVTNGALHGTSLNPDVYAAKSVGLIRAIDPAGILAINLDTEKAIGGSYQVADSAGFFGADLYANAGIGTIRTVNMGLDSAAPILSVNVDSKGNDGVIDLIDTTGSFGTLSAGGPQISTGPGGNVRYIHVAGGGPVFNDDFFGGDQDFPTNFAAGAAAAITDDSGTPIIITPAAGKTVTINTTTTGTGGTTTGTGTTTGGDTGGTTTGTTVTSTTSTLTPGNISVLTYGIEDKGGVVLINVTSRAGGVSTTDPTTGTVTTTTGTGSDTLTIRTNARGTGGSAEIGTLNLVGPGVTTALAPATTSVTTSAGTTTTVTNTPNVVTTPTVSDASVGLTGTSPIDVWDLVGSTNALIDGAATPALAGLNVVNNATNGEIVNVNAASVATLQAQTLGISKSASGGAVGGAVLNNTFPFHNQRTLIDIAGNAGTIEARGALGNILVDGTANNVLADIDDSKTDSFNEGIVGPIYATGVSGNFLNVNIGKGLGPTGTGNFAQNGIFADNGVGTVTNQGTDSDIRGDIVVSQVAGGILPTTTLDTITGLPIVSKAIHGVGINSINLTGGGSIINANIEELTNLSQALATDQKPVVIPDPNINTGATGTITGQQRFGIGTISLSGNGGILGSLVIAGGIGSISIPDGFGIINTDTVSLATDRIGSIVAGGYGIRSSFFSGQTDVGSITANGLGKEIPVTAFSPSVRESESGSTVESFTQQPLDTSNDLDRFLVVTKKVPKRKGATEAGVIADTTITGTGNLDSVKAFRIIGHTSTPVTPAQILASELDPLPLMRISFAGQVGKIQVKENTTRLRLTTGVLKSFDTGANFVSTIVNVSGTIGEMTAKFFNASTHINATGPDGVIGSLTSVAGLNAMVNASVDIGSINVGSDLGSASLDSSGNLDKLYVKGSVLAGANVRVAKTLGVLNVRHNVLGGSSIQAKKITTQLIGGQVFGNIVITG